MLMSSPAVLGKLTLEGTGTPGALVVYKHTSVYAAERSYTVSPLLNKLTVSCV